MSTQVETSIRDVQRTSNIVTTAQWSVASVVMAGSAYSAGLAFQHFGESFIAGFITGVAVDFALASWLLIARKLRASDVQTAWGPILEGATALMTLCLNSGVSILNEKYLLALFHAFLPAVLFILSMAGGEAQHKLHIKQKQKQAQEQAARDAQIAEDKNRYEADQRRRVEEKRAEDARLDQIRKDDLRKKELDNDKHQREMDDRRETRAHQEQLSVRGLAAALLVGSSLRRARELRSVHSMASAMLVSTSMRALAMASLKDARQGSAGHSRQASPAASPAPVASGSPADHQPVTSPRRQPTSPAANKRPPAATPDLARLVTLAKELLAREPAMGRPTLAKQLAEATGERVTDHLAKKVMAAIQDEREAQFKAELESVLGGQAGGQL